MQLSVYLLDPWAELAAHSHEGYFADLLNACSILGKAEWQLRAETTSHVFSQTQIQSNKNSISGLLKPADMEAEFCLLPVQLGVQRDSYHLQSMLTLPAAVYARLTQLLQAHFSHDFKLAADPQHRCWWVKPYTTLNADTPWPADCLFQHALAWQPQGEAGKTLRMWTNEIQMLLHQQLANTDHADWPPLLNSLWFASVSQNTSFSTPASQLAGSGRIFNAVSATLPNNKVIDLQAYVKGEYAQPSRALVYLADHLPDVDWASINTLLTQGKLQSLHLFIPYLERHVEITWQRAWRRQFWQPRYWRKPQTAHDLMTAMSKALPQHIAPEHMF